MLLISRDLVAFAAALLILTGGCTAEKSPIVKATVTRQYTLEDKNVDRQLLQPNVVTVVSDPSEAARLGSYFPDLGLEKKSRIAGGWIQFAEIEFERANGEKLSVKVDPDLVDWTEGGQGDFRTAQGFGPYFLTLLREAESAKEAVESQSMPTRSYAEKGVTNPESGKVVITRSFSLDEAVLLDEPVKTIIDDPLEVSRLASYFPQAGKGMTSPHAGAWIAFAKLQFLQSGGEWSSIAVSSDLSEWSEGDGDWELDPEFGPYFRELLRAKTEMVMNAQENRQQLLEQEKQRLEEEEEFYLEQDRYSVGSYLGHISDKFPEWRFTREYLQGSGTFFEDLKKPLDYDVSTPKELASELERKANVRVLIDESDKKHPVIHVIDKSLHKMSDILDRKIDFDYSGVVGDLPKALRKVVAEIDRPRSGPIMSGFLVGTDDSTKVTVHAKDETVRHILTHCVDLDNYNRTVWIADTIEFDDGTWKTQVLYVRLADDK
ncbi:MAG: hypothetical protein WEB58_05370 [Planctomycetaceae bacterium]